MTDQNVINILKGLVIDGVHFAKSGHPGGAMSSMDFAYTLFTEFLRFDPEDPQWIGRDRFVLSAGHESMLLYSMLHMVGWLPMDELKRFRQLGSKTPGHPENFLTPGVECTTGPLGQGAAMSVGMAIAARHLAGQLDETLFSQRIYALLGDGCMQEDVTLGAASLAGHLGLRNLIWFYDKNGVQIAGPIGRAVSDDFEKVFQGFGWQVIQVDGHDRDSIRSAIHAAREHADRPTLIIGQTKMANGAFSMEGLADTHGSPLPAEERKQTKKRLELPEQDFYCPDSAYAHFRRNFNERREQVKSWKAHRTALESRDPSFKKRFDQYGQTPDFSVLPDLEFKPGSAVATRNVFGDLLCRWQEALPQLIGGSADLDPSNMTEEFAKKVGDFHWNKPKARNIAFGVREFPMACVSNGISLFGGLIPFDATFLVFSDYARPALRLNALQQRAGIHELTHDSFYLGEDGPTHQPIEHLMSLRLIPDLYVMRPADAQETQVMFKSALAMKRPVALCLSRQKLPLLEHNAETLAGMKKGAYVAFSSQNGTSKDSPLLLIATGSEVDLAIQVAKARAAKGESVRVVSMPCWELFLEQPASYQESILPKTMTRRVSIEAGATLGWQRFVGSHGLTIGIDHFGASAKAEDLAKEFGFTVDAVLKKIEDHNFF